jgi:hypothetical protein
MDIVVGGFPQFKIYDHAATYIKLSKLQEVWVEYLSSLTSKFMAREYDYELQFSELFIDPVMDYYAEVIKHSGKMYKNVIC